MPDFGDYFDGETFDRAHDGPRLKGQLAKVRDVMVGGEWVTLKDLAFQVKGSEAGVSARIRDLRKEKFGGYTIERRRLAGGLWEYRMLAPKPQTQGSLF